MKVTTEILDKDSNVKVITVTVDEETAKILESLEDKQIRDEYLLMLDEERRQNRRERDHCCSLNKLVKKHWDKADESVDIERQVDSKLEWDRILSHLTKEERFIVTELYAKDKSQRQVCAAIGISESSFSERLATLKKKLKKFYEKPEVLFVLTA